MAFWKREGATFIPKGGLSIDTHLEYKKAILYRSSGFRPSFQIPNFKSNFENKFDSLIKVGRDEAFGIGNLSYLRK